MAAGCDGVEGTHPWTMGTGQKSRVGAQRDGAAEVEVTGAEKEPKLAAGEGTGQQGRDHGEM